MPSLNQSSLYRQGASAQTQTVVSSRVKIYAPLVDVGSFKKVGVMSTFSLSETRNLETIRGLGYGDQVAELVPGYTEPMSINVTRTALYLANLMQMFGYKAGVSGAVKSLKHHKWPFDIRTEIVLSELANIDPSVKSGGEATIAPLPPEGGLNNTGNPGLYCIATIFAGCWMTSYSTEFNTGTAAVAETATIQITDLWDISGSVYGEFLDSGNSFGDVTGASLIFAENNIANQSI